jgi:protein TonB
MPHNPLPALLLLSAALHAGGLLLSPLERAPHSPVRVAVVLNAQGASAGPGSTETAIGPPPLGAPAPALPEPLQPRAPRLSRRSVPTLHSSSTVVQTAGSEAGASSQFGSLSGVGLAGGAASWGGSGTLSPLESYASLLSQLLNKHKHYPPSARRRGIEGKVTVRLRLDQTGQLRDYGIEESASRELGAAALQMVKSAAPFPPFPSSLEQSELELLVPIRFSLSSS